MTFLCHRNCAHCYEDRFHPYYGEELAAVLEESRSCFPKIISNFPDRMTYFIPGDPVERTGRIILAGGEILLPAVRETVLYPGLELLHRKYKNAGGIELIVQTTGDIVTADIVRELLQRHVNVLSVSGLDAFHAGLEEESAREALKAKLTRMFTDQGMAPFPATPNRKPFTPGDGPYFSFFGATPESWIGKIWPRGRAHANELSTATLADNFCNGWSGGLNFLAYRHAGSEVSVEPNGNVYPCCMKTRLAIGNLREEKLENILARLAGNPVYQAISKGRPEQMGLSHGWSVDRFLEASETTLPSGRVYRNLCVGCDAFHSEVLMTQQSPLVTLNAG